MIRHHRRPSTPLLLALGILPLLAACGEAEQARMVGTLERDRVELAVESNEPIAEILVVDGATVTAGEAILRQDATRSTGRLEQAQAQRDQAAARLAELRRGPRAEDIAQARAELAASEALTRNSRANYEREKELFERGLGEAQARDNRRDVLADAVAREESQRQALERLLNGTTVEELDQAEAELRSLQAAVELAELDLQRLVVTAPMNGVLDRVRYESGERPQAGTTVAVLLDSASTYARIYVPEPLRATLTPGSRLQVAVDGIEAPLEGTVRWVSSDASFTPYFALTEYDRSRLAYLAEVDLPGAAGLPAGVPLEAWLP